MKLIRLLSPPIKSASDKKDYRVIRLENGLTACLVADKVPMKINPLDKESINNDAGTEKFCPSKESDVTDDKDQEFEIEQKMAAAALCIGVGSFSDPKEVPGMAHFLEHMVFMGSEKFPIENDFDAFISKGGGNDNALTGPERTLFYFECLEKHFYDALDKLAQFFISPLMKKESMTRERESIESEFQIALPSDDERVHQLMCSLAVPGSPINSFSCGNLITLRDNTSDDKLYEKLHKFRGRHYSAHRMTLAIQARLPMDTLEKYVTNCFSNVPNNQLPPDDFSHFENGVFNTIEFKRMYYVKSIKDVCQVTLTWSLPSLINKYDSKPELYIANIMGDEGKGSLLSYLKKKVWVLDDSVGVNASHDSSWYSLFNATMVLTESGFEHLFEVIEAIYSYINLLRRIGPQKRLYDEMKLIIDTRFRYAEENTACDMVTYLCEAMQLFPSEDYIAGSEIFYKYDPEAINMIIDLLQPDKMNILVLANKLPDNLKYEKVEKWFGTEYTDIEIPDIWCEKLRTVEPYSELNIRPPNPYLTTDFSILPNSEIHPDYPEKLIDSPLIEIWYRRDQKFRLPYAYYYFGLISPIAIESAANCTLLDMFVTLFDITINEEVYPASCAGLSFVIYAHEKGLILNFSGYNEKLPLLIEVVSNYLVKINDHFTDEIFQAIKDKLIKSYYNSILDPSTMADNVTLNLLANKQFSLLEKHSAALEMTFEHIKSFTERFMEYLYVKTLVQGNVSREEAYETVNKFVNNLQYRELSKSSYPEMKVGQLPKGEKCCKFQGFDENNSNSIIANYYQSGPFSMQARVIIDIIMLIIQEPLFDTLRTKEQLSYDVSCGVRDTFDILGFAVTVKAQAPKHTVQYVDCRIEEFLKYSQHLLHSKTEKEWNQTKKDLIKKKLCSDVYLREEVDRNWSEIINDRYLFDRLKQEIELIRNINSKEIIDWWEKHNIFGDKENFRKLSVQVVGHITKEKIQASNRSGLCEDTLARKKLNMQLFVSEEKEVQGDEYFIKDIENFKENICLFPSNT